MRWRALGRRLLWRGARWVRDRAARVAIRLSAGAPDEQPPTRDDSPAPVREALRRDRAEAALAQWRARVTPAAPRHWLERVEAAGRHVKTIWIHAVAPGRAPLAEASPDPSLDHRVPQEPVASRESELEAFTAAPAGLGAPSGGSAAAPTAQNQQPAISWRTGALRQDSAGAPAADAPRAVSPFAGRLPYPPLTFRHSPAGPPRELRGAGESPGAPPLPAGDMPRSAPERHGRSSTPEPSEESRPERREEWESYPVRQDAPTRAPSGAPRPVEANDRGSAGAVTAPVTGRAAASAASPPTADTFSPVARTRAPADAGQEEGPPRGTEEMETPDESGHARQSRAWPSFISSQSGQPSPRLSVYSAVAVEPGRREPLDEAPFYEIEPARGWPALPEASSGADEDWPAMRRRLDRLDRLDREQRGW